MSRKHGWNRTRFRARRRVVGHCVLFSALVPGALSWIIRLVWSQVVQIAVSLPSSPVLGLPPSQILCRRNAPSHRIFFRAYSDSATDRVGALRGGNGEDGRRRRRRSAGVSGDTRAVARCCPPWLEQESERASTRLPPVSPVPHLPVPSLSLAHRSADPVLLHAALTSVRLSVAPAFSDVARLVRSLQTLPIAYPLAVKFIHGGSDEYHCSSASCASPPPGLARLAWRALCHQPDTSSSPHPCSKLAHLRRHPRSLGDFFSRFALCRLRRVATAKGSKYYGPCSHIGLSPWSRSPFRLRSGNHRANDANPPCFRTVRCGNLATQIAQCAMDAGSSCYVRTDSLRVQHLLDVARNPAQSLAALVRVNLVLGDQQPAWPDSDHTEAPKANRSGLASERARSGTNQNFGGQSIHATTAKRFDFDGAR